MSPAKFNIPEDHKIQPEVESSSESTSRETTPESDDDDEDEDNEDEEEEVVEQDDDQGDNDDEFPISAKPIIQRDQDELIQTYARFFPEYTNPSVRNMPILTVFMLAYYYFYGWKLGLYFVYCIVILRKLQCEYFCCCKIDECCCCCCSTYAVHLRVCLHYVVKWR